MIHRFLRRRFDPRGESIWLTIYADMITNLMLVFLAMYGLTVMGKEALQQALESMRAHGAQAETTHVPFNMLAPALKETMGALPDVDVVEDAGAVRLQFGENVLFNSGSAVLKASASSPLTSACALLRMLPNTVVVEGHTDAVPVSASSGFASNYELSLARSMAVVHLLIDQGGLPAAQVAAAAYGEHRPRSTNASETGRRMNRRVEIAIFRDFPYAGPARGGIKAAS